MSFRDVLKTSLISLLWFYLVLTHEYALSTVKNSSSLLTRDYDLMTWTDAEVKIDVYSELNCADDKFQIADASLTYVMNYYLESKNESSNFRFFEISRALKNQEKLNLRKFDQDSNDTKIWSYKIFVTHFMIEMNKDFYNISRNESSTCLQLWQF